MPLELGMLLGAQRFGSGLQKQKSCLVLDRENYWYQEFISDTAGQYIAAHGEDVGQAIKLPNRCRPAPKRRLVPGEGIEPPTFGLQNRCTTAVLTRHEPRPHP